MCRPIRGKRLASTFLSPVLKRGNENAEARAIESKPASPHEIVKAQFPA